MSAGNINMSNKSMHISTSLNSRQQNLANANGGRLKSGVKKINQSSSVNPADRENNQKV